MDAHLRISIVVAGYNEEKNIRLNFPKLVQYLENQCYNYEFIFVDDGSSDQSVSLFQSLAKNNQYLRLITFSQNRGKGAAIKEGVLQATGDYICYTDADLSYDVNIFPACLASLKNYDAVIGNRVDTHSRYIVSPNVLHTIFIRHMVSRIYNIITRNLLRVGNIEDIQCGFKCFNRKIARQIFPAIKTTGFCFDAEVLMQCQRQGFSIQQLPVVVHYKTDKTSINLVKHPFIMLYEILKIWFRAPSK